MDDEPGGVLLASKATISFIVLLEHLTMRLDRGVLQMKRQPLQTMVDKSPNCFNNQSLVSRIEFTFGTESAQFSI